MNIATSGKFGAGKDEVCDLIKIVFPKMLKFPLALSLKEYCSTFLSVKAQELNESDIKNSIAKIRDNWDSILFWEKRFDIIGETIDKDLLKKLTLECVEMVDGKKSCGEILQLVGTEIFRKKVRDDIWINVWYNRVKPFLKTGVLCSDIRFKNEATFLKELGFIIIRIECPLEIRLKRIKTVRDPNHISETDLDNYNYFDKIIQNDSTLLSLKLNVSQFLEKITT